MHTLIIGGQGVGKSTLIRRVVSELGVPVWGFETKKENPTVDGSQGCPVYIYEAGRYVRSEKNLVGYCDQKVFGINKDAFDRFAKKLQLPVPDGHIIVMDELGIMETVSNDFCDAVLSLLNGDIPIIAAVKNKDRPYLEAVRNHSNSRCFYLTEENRETVYQQVLEQLKGQL